MGVMPIADQHLENDLALPVWQRHQDALAGQDEGKDAARSIYRNWRGQRTKIMSNDIIHAAMATWAAKDLPARLHAAQVAKLLNCTPEDVAILVSAGKLKALGRPRPNGVKLFSTIELFTW